MPARTQRIEAGGKTGTCGDHLTGRRAVAGADRVAVAQLERIDAEAPGELVEQGLGRDHRLRHAEAAEGARRRLIGIDGAAFRAQSGHDIGTAGVDGDAVRHCRSP